MKCNSKLTDHVKVINVKKFDKSLPNIIFIILNSFTKSMIGYAIRESKHLDPIRITSDIICGFIGIVLRNADNDGHRSAYAAKKFC